MRMYDIILKKRRGFQLTTEEINFFVNGFNNNEIPDYQVSSLMMAIFFKGMNERETADLTMAMANSGEILDLSAIDGIKVDKHSTGGVGDSVTLVLAPLVASLGIPVAKMSGRGLGHTGGTIDKLETFKGFSVELDNDTFINNVNNIKIAIAGQTKSLAPADKKLYALRDVTATVDNISLIASSIMSKKIASGADAIVLDVKVGDGAFMKNLQDAKALAKEMVTIGEQLGRRTVAIISNMDQPLGFAIGNALEVKEAIDTLKGNGPKDLEELVLEIGSQMVILSKKAKSVEEAKKLLRENLTNGKALNKLKELVEAQGGDSSIIDNEELMPKSKYQLSITSDREGYVSKICSEEVGLLAMELGAGRKTKDSIIDLSVGIVLKKKIGDKVEKGEELATIYCNNEKDGSSVLNKLKDVIVVSDVYEEYKLIYEVVK
ncbi:pyrimidine-nucleoside phosphorylase [Clostridium bornimense]|uniref:pyrimidine-nucleoside phosphorylase n=1 Tax=Clostridium bornimense TaxID=1216932 RepID=UPI001C1009A6|nr:pyrimidine-nucleoside phosphorylase [Clostridium bornimense]MBU5315851.1 pyrimidine-nucleoside phosphorylase [Clostridium bornimense]